MDRNWTDRLSEYLDGELGRGETAALEARLAEDADLRTMLEQVRAVKKAAAAAASEHWAPADELWAGIEARIEPRGATRAIAARGGRNPRRTLMFTLPQLAAAAGIVLLLGVSVGRLTEGPGAPTPAVTTQVATQGAATPVAAGASYAGFVADLEQRLDAGRDVLQPETARVIEQSLAKIDTAIVQARTALDNDPNNAYLNQHLASAQARKLRLLEDATTLIASKT